MPGNINLRCSNVIKNYSFHVFTQRRDLRLELRLLHINEWWNMKRERKPVLLTRQELKIMKVIWERGPSTVKDVWEAMSKEKPIAYTTVLTIMAILERKEVLTHDKSRHAFVYHPLISRGQVTRNHVRDIVAQYFDDKPENLLAFVCMNEKVAFKPKISGNGKALNGSKECGSLSERDSRKSARSANRRSI